MESWLAQSEDQTKPDELYRYAVVLDFEATCWEAGQSTDSQEIIEFPAVIVDLAAPQNQPPIAEFHRYVLPTQNPLLSEFCTELTGITQDKIAGQMTIDAVLQEFAAWIGQQTYLTSNETGFNFVMCTDGNWDLGGVFPSEINRKQLNHLVPGYLRCGWCDIRKYFSEATGERGGMRKMLAYLRLPLQGRHHSGIDDSRNLARILKRVAAVWRNPVDVNQYPGRKVWKSS
eukprot:CAMPEP_0202839766 /NCGR_PEP_ID=MMETSP1389-20130828/53729_1 /ASSEMBLY_ACC=CAM_ASM_000865 /TAXON_ID=302021 /ORGANISM="Rhodomonas sp., Strain CCMP768" /LENGTH=229 /DNA_ID=CAMNT_0049516287 /DNA_START=1 /DNA_END=690 /DNA_ORIENTATION=+